MKECLRLLSIIALLICVSGCGGSTTTPPPVVSITGAWAGTITDSGSTPVSTTGNLVQGITNTDGSILFSGSLSIPSGCVTLLQISGKILGGSFALNGTFSDGTVLNVTGAINAADTSITGNFSQVGGTVCGTGTGTFALSKQ